MNPQIIKDINGKIICDGDIFRDATGNIYQILRNKNIDKFEVKVIKHIICTNRIFPLSHWLKSCDILMYKIVGNISDTQPKIIDVCCGSKMFWFNKSNPDTVYMDIRELEDTLCDGRKLVVRPDVIGDFRNIPYPDNSFKLAVFDPPHLIKLGEKSWMAKKYGKLKDTWQSDIKLGFEECMRVLEPFGILIFKWNEEQIKVSDVLRVIDYKPLFGDRRSKTIWMVFMKR